MAVGHKAWEKYLVSLPPLPLPGPVRRKGLLWKELGLSRKPATQPEDGAR